MAQTVLALVQQYDYERYLTTLFMKTRMRPALWALYAFNVEIAKTREVTTQATIGLIRLQWWRDAVTRLFEGKADAHEVLQALDQALKSGCMWQEADFQALIEARERDLYDEAFSEEDFWNYCRDTSVPLVRLTLRSVGEVEQEAIMANIAQAYAAMGLLRIQRFVPEGLSPQQIVATIEKKIKEKPKTKTVSLYYRLVKIHLKKLKKAQYDVKAPSFAQSDPLLAFRLWLMR